MGSEADCLIRAAESVKAIICKLSPDGKVLKINKHGLEFLGYKEEEIIGRDAFGTIFPPKADAASASTAGSGSAGSLLEKAIPSGTLEVVRKDGTRALVNWSSCPCGEGDQEEIIAIGVDVTEHSDLERMLKVREERDRAVLRIISLLLREDLDLEAVSDAVLEEAKRLTGSEYGFVGTIDQETGELVGHTLRKGCALGSTATRFAPGPDGEYRSLFGHALNTRTPFFTNSPSSHPASRGPPAGHIPVKQFLAVPVLLDARYRPLGIIALANPEEGRYDADDLEAVCELSYYFALSLNRRLLEERIRRSEKYYRELFEGIPIPVFLVNADGRLERVNRELARLLGYPKEELEGRSWEDAVHPKHLQRMREYRKARLSGEGNEAPVSYETTLVRKDGSPVDCQLNVVFVEGEKGRFLGSLFDLTEIKRVQRELEESKRELERHASSLEKLVEEKTLELMEKERLAAIGGVAMMVGHDLRNPLQAITKLAFTMKEVLGEAQQEGACSDPECRSGKKLSAVAAELSELIQKLEKNVKYMDKIVSDLQDFSRPLAVELAPTRLRRVIEDALVSIDVPENVELRIGIGRPEDGVSVDADANAKENGGGWAIDRGKLEDLEFLLPSQLIVRMLKNLILNAIQAMPVGGRLTISAWVEEAATASGEAEEAAVPTTAPASAPAPAAAQPQPQPQQPAQVQVQAQADSRGIGGKNAVVVFSVSDTGKGIPAEIMKDLFKPFKTTKPKGTGLGLSIVKRIADAVGGTVGVESEPGKGTRFTIRVPATAIACGGRAPADGQDQSPPE